MGGLKEIFCVRDGVEINETDSQRPRCWLLMTLGTCVGLRAMLPGFKKAVDLFIGNEFFGLRCVSACIWIFGSAIVVKMFKWLEKALNKKRGKKRGTSHDWKTSKRRETGERWIREEPDSVAVGSSVECSDLGERIRLALCEKKR